MALVFIGGLRWSGGMGTINATWPMARLTLNDVGVRIGASSPVVTLLTLVFGGLPTIRATWAQVSRAEFCRGVLFASPGLRIWLLQKNRPLVFWARDDKTVTSILEQFRNHGVEVDMSPHRVSLLGL